MHKNTNICVPGSYCCVESGGVGKEIFSDAKDYKKLYSIIQSILSKNDLVEIAAYCVLPDRFYLLLCETENGNINDFLKALVGGINSKFHISSLSVDSLTKKAINQKDIIDCSCKIHRCAVSWKNCEHSSVRAYLYGDAPDWLRPKHIKDLCGSSTEYYRYLRLPINRKLKSIINSAIKKR